MPGWETFEAFLAEAEQAPSNDARQDLVRQLLRERRTWPWVQGDRATFIYAGANANTVALNLDTVKSDPPFIPLTRLGGTSLWYATHEFTADDLLDYLLAVDDPMTPLATEPDIAARVARHWRTDPLNPRAMRTGQVDVSVLKMDRARPFPNWTRYNITRGETFEHEYNSAILKVNRRKVWVHTPPGYADSGLVYPLLILQDGQWMVGPLQVPDIADTLLKHGRMAPVIIAMLQSGSQQERIRDYVMNDLYDEFISKELLPFLQSQYRIDSTVMGIGGASAGAIAAADAALDNPQLFNSLILLSPPLGKGPAQEKLMVYLDRFRNARLLPKSIFQAVGRYEVKSRFYRPAYQLREMLAQRPDVDYRFAEYGSGHGLVGFRSILPEALAWAFPGASVMG